MSQADRTYYTRRAEQERRQAEHARTLEARAVHRQLRDLYRLQAASSSDTPLVANVRDHA